MVLRKPSGLWKSGAMSTCTKLWYPTSGVCSTTILLALSFTKHESSSWKGCRKSRTIWILLALLLLVAVACSPLQSPYQKGVERWSSAEAREFPNESHMQGVNESMNNRGTVLNKTCDMLHVRTSVLVTSTERVSERVRGWESEWERVRERLRERATEREKESHSVRESHRARERCDHNADLPIVLPIEPQMWTLKMWFLDVINYDDHCTVVIAIHWHLISPHETYDYWEHGEILSSTRFAHTKNKQNTRTPEAKHKQHFSEVAAIS